jgi:hypothetical protein
MGECRVICDQGVAALTRQFSIDHERKSNDAHFHRTGLHIFRCLSYILAKYNFVLQPVPQTERSERFLCPLTVWCAPQICDGDPPNPWIV